MRQCPPVRLSEPCRQHHSDVYGECSERRSWQTVTNRDPDDRDENEVKRLIGNSWGTAEHEPNRSQTEPTLSCHLQDRSCRTVALNRYRWANTPPSCQP